MLKAYGFTDMNNVGLSLAADRGLVNPALDGDVSVITSLLGYDREAAAYVQSLGLKAVAVVLMRLYYFRSPEQGQGSGDFFVKGKAMSKKVGANIQCPECSHSFPTQLYRSIWVEESANRSLIMNDQINAVTCPKCKFHLRLEFPFLATNVKRGFALWYEPYPDPQIDKDAEGYRKMMGANSFYAKAPRISDWSEFKRTLIQMEANGNSSKVLPGPDHPLARAAEAIESQLIASGSKKVKASQTPSSQLQATFVPRRHERTTPQENPVSDNLQTVRIVLEKMFAGYMKEKGMFPTIAETKDFPFPDFNETVSALRSGKAYLSFGVPSSTAFNVVSTKSEKAAHTFSIVLSWIIAPLVLIGGAIAYETYWILLWLAALLPLGFFGTNPFYKKAPLFLLIIAGAVIGGISNESAEIFLASLFLFFAIAGFSSTRWLYNRVLIGRALEMESAMLFLLGGNYLHLCGADWSFLWTPTWMKEARR